MQNFGPILHIFRLWSRISVERDKISKIGKTCDLERFLPRSAKQVRWTLVHYPDSRIVVHVSLDPPKSTFSTDYISISASRGCWTLKFLHTLVTGKGLLAHTTDWARGPPKNSKGEYLKLGLKFHICAPMTLGLVDITSRNFTRWCGS